MPERPKQEIMLLKASLRGDAAAFGEIVGDYQSLVCAITYSGTRNVETSEELAQEVFLKAWKSLSQLKDLGKFRAWLCSIARSAVQNWFRTQKRDTVSRAAPLDAAAGNASVQHGPEEAAMINEQRAVVDHALAGIPEGLREPLVLFYREDKSIRQVAQQLGLSEPATRQRIARGRSMLRENVAAIVETTIARTKPGAAFKTAVMAAIAATVVKTGATAGAASSQAAAGAGGVAAGVGAKVAAVAAAVVIAGGGFVALHVARRGVVPRSSLVAETAGPQSAPRQSAEALVPTVPRPAREDATTVREALAPSLETSSESSAPSISVAEAPETTQATTHTRATDATFLASAGREFEFKPKGILSGLITDIETGEPVTDAKVRIDLSRVSEADVDTNGFYTFEKVHQSGSHRIQIMSREYVGITSYQKAPAVHLSNDAQTVRHFQLPKACMVDLWVVDANDVPVADARVVATSLADRAPYEVGYWGDRKETDPNGYILIGGIPPADTEYLITVWHDADGQYDYAPAKAVLRLDDPNVVTEVKVILEKGQTVHGYAEYADGVPAEGIGIIPRPAWWHTNYSVRHYDAGADGLFTLPHIKPGRYSIHMYIARPDGSGGTSSAVMETELPPEDGEPLVVRLPAKSPQSLASISGTVIFTGEKHPSYVRISAYSPAGGHGFGHLDRMPNGELSNTFLIDRLEPGTYRLSFQGAEIEEKVMDGVEAPSAGLEVELVYASKPKLKGTVVDGSTGEPVASFKVRPRKLRTLRGANYVQADRWVHVENPRGFFSVEAVGPGIYQVQVDAKGYAPAWSEEVNTDEANPVQLSLTTGGAIAGRVVDKRGQVISGAKVVPLSKAGGLMPRTKETFVNEEGAVEAVEGRFRLEHLPVGAETLKATHPDYAPAVVEGVLVTEGQTTTGIDITMSRGGAIEGYVFDDKHNPLANEAIHVQDQCGYGGVGDEDAGRLGTAVTDANGFYRVSHLPEQLCYVNRANEAGLRGVVRRTVVPWNGRVTRLDFGGTPLVSGAIVIDGAPLTNTRVLLGPVHSPHFGTFRAYTTTDDHGTFVFAGAARGTHAIYCEEPGRRAKWLKMATVAVAGTDVDLGVVGNTMSDLQIIVNQPDPPSPAWQIAQVFITDREEPYAAALRNAEKPAGDGAPWTIRNVEPSTYLLTLVRRDQVRWLQRITLASDRGRWEVAVDLPKATARVFGDVRGAESNWLRLWQPEKHLWATVRVADDGTFAVESLPAGEYAIGADSALTFGGLALAEFTLAPGDSKQVDVDASRPSGQLPGFLLVYVVDEGGQLRDDAKVRLEGLSQTIEPRIAEGGVYSFSALVQRYTLHVEVAGYDNVTQPVTLEPLDRSSSERQTVLVRLSAP